LVPSFNHLKKFLLVQNFNQALKIGLIFIDSSGLEKAVDRFERFRLALFKNHR